MFRSANGNGSATLTPTVTNCPTPTCNNLNSVIVHENVTDAQALPASNGLLGNLNSCPSQDSSSSLYNIASHEETFSPQCNVESVVNGNKVTVYNDVLCQESSETEAEQLEKKYGGYLRARRAATTIQLAYRRYSMNRNFAKLRLQSTESRRFASECRREKTSDIIDKSPSSSDTHQMALVNMTINGNDLVNRTLRLSSGSCHYPMSVDIDIDAVPDGSRNYTACNNDSSNGSSPLPSPDGAILDLPSINFENLLEGRVESSTKGLHVSVTSPSLDLQCPNFDGSSSHYGGRRQSTPLCSRSCTSVADVAERDARMPASVFIPVCKDSVICNGDIGGTCSKGFGKISSTAVDIGSALYRLHGGRLAFDSDVRLRRRKCSSGCDCALPPELTNYTLSHLAHLQSSGGGCSESSPIWKRKSTQMNSCVGDGGPYYFSTSVRDAPNVDAMSELSDEQACCTERSESSEQLCSSASSDTTSVGSGGELHQRGTYRSSSCISNELHLPPSHQLVTEKQRKRLYRIGLNFFNKLVASILSLF